MKRAGIICDLSFEKHTQFKNYYYALTEVYGSIRIVYSIKDLEGLDVLFIGDGCFGPHMDVYQQKGFLPACDEKEISVVLFSSEKINSSRFPHVYGLYQQISKCKKFYQYNYDVDDVEIFKSKLHRLSMSRHYKDYLRLRSIPKQNKVIFFGTIYSWRRPVLEYISSHFELDVFNSDNRSWEEYLKLIAGYRFVLSPLGDANALVTRFYETLLVGSIPLQQVKENTLLHYDIESTFRDCIFFRDVKKLSGKLVDFDLQSSSSEIWLEDYLTTILKEDNLL